jgi:hypothetical protein
MVKRRNWSKSRSTSVARLSSVRMNLRGNNVRSLAIKRSKKKRLTLVTDVAEAVTTAVDGVGRKTSSRAATTMTPCTRRPLASRRRRAASSKSPTSTTKKPSRLSDRPVTVDNDGLVKCFAAKYGAEELAMGS